MIQIFSTICFFLNLVNKIGPSFNSFNICNVDFILLSHDYKCCVPTSVSYIKAPLFILSNVA